MCLREFESNPNDLHLVACRPPARCVTLGVQLMAWEMAMPDHEHATHNLFGAHSGEPLPQLTEQVSGRFEISDKTLDSEHPRQANSQPHQDGQTPLESDSAPEKDSDVGANDLLTDGGMPPGSGPAANGDTPDADETGEDQPPWESETVPELGTFELKRRPGRPKGECRRGADGRPTTRDGRENEKIDRGEWIADAVDTVAHIGTLDRLVGDGGGTGAAHKFDWFERRGQAWVTVRGSAVRARIRDALESSPLNVGRSTNRQTVIDAMGDLANVCIPAGTPADPADFGRAWHLDTGDFPVVSGGLPWADGVIVAVNDDRTGLVTCKLDPLHFHRGGEVPFEFRDGTWQPTPMFDRFLAELVREDSIDWLKAMIGRTLLRDHTSHGMVNLIGIGGGGKSTLMLLLSSLVGGASRTVTSPAELGRQFGRTGLDTVSLLIIPDAPEGRHHDTTPEGLSVIKSMVAAEPITIERKNHDPQSLTVELTLWMLSNPVPKWTTSSTETEAWGRRLFPIGTRPSPTHRTVIDKFDAVLLDAEGRDIAVSCVAAYASLLAEGGMANVPLAPSMRNLRRQSVTGQLGTADQWVEDCVDKSSIGDQDAWTWASDIKASLTEWAEQLGTPVPQHHGKALSNLGVTSTTRQHPDKGRKLRGFAVRLLNEETEEQEFPTRRTSTQDNHFRVRVVETNGVCGAVTRDGKPLLPVALPAEPAQEGDEDSSEGSDVQVAPEGHPAQGEGFVEDWGVHPAKRKKHPAQPVPVDDNSDGLHLPEGVEASPPLGAQVGLF